MVININIMEAKKHKDEHADLLTNEKKKRKKQRNANNNLKNYECIIYI